jgi:hypothetical protein
MKSLPILITSKVFPTLSCTNFIVYLINTAVTTLAYSRSQISGSQDFGSGNLHTHASNFHWVLSLQPLTEGYIMGPWDPGFWPWSELHYQLPWLFSLQMAGSSWDLGPPQLYEPILIISIFMFHKITDWLLSYLSIIYLLLWRTLTNTKHSAVSRNIRSLVIFLDFQKWPLLTFWIVSFH